MVDPQLVTADEYRAELERMGADEADIRAAVENLESGR